MRRRGLGVRKAPSPRRRWRGEVRFCLCDGKSLCRSQVARGAGRCLLGALHAVCDAACVILHAGSVPVWLLDFYRCPNRKCCAAPRELCANAVKLQWLAQTLPGLLRARHFDRSARCEATGFATALASRWVPKREHVGLNARDRAAGGRSGGRGRVEIARSTIQRRCGSFSVAHRAKADPVFQRPVSAKGRGALDMRLRACRISPETIVAFGPR